MIDLELASTRRGRSRGACGAVEARCRPAIRDRVTLVRGETSWRFDEPTKEVELPGLEPDAHGRIRGRYRWRGPGERRVLVESPHLGPDGTYLLRVPAGRGAWTAPH